MVIRICRLFRQPSPLKFFIQGLHREHTKHFKRRILVYDPSECIEFSVSLFGRESVKLTAHLHCIIGHQFADAARRPQDQTPFVRKGGPRLCGRNEAGHDENIFVPAIVKVSCEHEKRLLSANGALIATDHLPNGGCCLRPGERIGPHHSAPARLGYGNYNSAGPGHHALRSQGRFIRTRQSA